MSGAHLNLTFEKGVFTLHSDVTPPKNLFLQEYWVGRPPLYRTKDLKAAVPFRPYADEHAEKVFTRVLSRMMEAPRLPSLSFLDDHQREGINWILTRSRSYIAHCPGAGKTLQAIVASIYTKAKGQTVFIVPPTLTTQWAKEIEKFSVGLVGFKNIGVVRTSKERLGVAWRAPYIIVPDSMLAKPWVHDRLLEMKIKFLAVDEASRFKEPTSLRSIALYGGLYKRRRYKGLVHRTRHTVFLDGSPMPSRPMELWAPTYALDPEAIDCMLQTDFGFRYCGPTVNNYGAWEFKHSSNEDELRTRLQKRFMHVVNEDQLSHPERRRSMLFINEDVRTPMIKDWERAHLDKLRSAKFSEEMNQGTMAEMRRELGVAKAKWIARYVLDRITEKRESILLFVWHREVAERIFDLFNRKLKPGRAGLVYGGTDTTTREMIFSDFQAGKLRVIVGNIMAMGRGHNLQKADRVIFGEFAWTDELNKQCEKRASRRGSEKEFVRCEYIVAPGTIDEVVLNSIFTKERRVKRVIG